MKRVTIWDYSLMTREHDLLLQNNEKEVMIKNYYHDMKNRTCGKILFFY